MARVQPYTAEEVDILVTDFTKVVESAIDRVAQSTANGLQPAVVASSSAGLSPADVSNVAALWQEEIDGALAPYIAQVYSGSATNVAVGLVSAFPDHDLVGVPLITSEFTDDYMKSVSNRLVGVGNELWEDIRNELLDGIHQGLSVEQIAARIVNVSQFTKQRALTIARTEVHGATEAGALQQMFFVGYDTGEATKEWLATEDARTRESHMHADHQTVDIKAKFTVGGWPLDHPGDTTAPAEEVINCRCSVAYDIVDPPKYRCNGGLVASSVHPTASSCIVPSSGNAADISFLTQSQMLAIFNEFKKAGITPAYGGAKIYKVLQETRQTLKTIDEVLASLDDAQMLKVIDHYYVAKKDTFGAKFDVWAQSPAGKKALGTEVAKVTHVVAPVSETTPAMPVKPPTLPAVAPKPMAHEITFTGKTLGSHGAQVWVNPSTGQKWLFKPQPKFATDLDIATARIQSKAMMTRPGVYEMTLNGQHGSIQYMFDSHEAWPHGSFDIMKLSAQDIFSLQQEQIFDWMVSNFDTHTGQWIRLSDGTLFETDKGQAFKFFGKDKLSWDYVPVTPLGQDKLTYSPLWKAFVQGKKLQLQDPTKGELGAYIDRLMAIDDKTYKDLLRPYASAFKSGKELEDFLDAAVARKNNLKTDFEAFWQSAVKEREKHLPVSAVVPSAPVPTVAPLSAPAASGGISSVDYATKVAVKQAWLKLNDGKNVTPAYGGSKIFKQLIELHKNPEFAELTKPQLIKILDEANVGKPKTLESVLTEWLQTPQGQKAAAAFKFDVKMFTEPVTVAQVTSTVTPVVTPQVIDSKTMLSILDTAPKKSPLQLWSDLPKYKDGEIVGFGENASGFWKIEKVTTPDGEGVKLYFRTGPNTWNYEDTFVGPSSLEKYIDIDHEKWSMVDPTKPVTSKIPGKGPNDSVSVSEIWQSKGLWNEGDIVATAQYKSPTTGTVYEKRLVIENGKLTYQQRVAGTSEWSSKPMLSSHSMVSIKEFDWKLSGEVLQTKKLSIIPGKNAGDTLLPEDIMTQVGNTKLLPSTTIAYAHSSHAGMSIEYRIVQSPNGLLELQSRLLGDTTWSPGLPVTGLDDLKLPGATKWFAANADGSMPDVVKSMTPGKTVPKVTPAEPAKPTVVTPSPSAKVLPPSGQTYFKKPNGQPVLEGEQVNIYDILPNFPKYPDGYIIAQGTTIFNWAKGTINIRLVKVDEYLILQKQTATGAWQFEKVITEFYHMPGASVTQLTATAEKLTPQALKTATNALNKHIGKYAPAPKASTATKAAKKVTTAKPVASSSPSAPISLRHVDLTPWNADEQKEIFDYVRTHQKIYASSSPESVWGALQAAKSHFQSKYGDKYLGLHEIEILRIYDAHNAMKAGVTDTHMLESKMVQWLKTPSGRSFINKRIDAPIAAVEIPQPMMDFASSTIDPDHQTYKVMDFSQTLADRQASHAKYGGWKAGEQEALKTYTGGSYSSWNDAIRKGELGSYKSKIIKAQQGMRPSTTPMLLHRGCSFVEFNDPSITSYETLLPYVGKTYTNRGFNSTSYGGHAAFSGSLLIEFECPIGTSMALVKDFSHHPSENEVLLPTHLVYKILSVKKNGSQTVMRVRVLGAATP